MMSKKKQFGILCSFLFLANSFILHGEEKLPNDVRWVRLSAEYSTLCEQLFRQTTMVILRTVKVEKSSGNLAVVVDLDETVLNNSLYQVERWKSGLSFTQDSWSDWVKREEAKLVSGAKDFLIAVRKKGVRVIFLSNRMNNNLKPTQGNLEALGVLDPSDLFLLRENKSDTKEIRRKEVLEGTGRMKEVGPLKVIGYVGDQMGDFPNDRIADFGKINFLLPNPMYGKW
jgi:5'-nucleotidase (lipoprotein e(P4) family)